MDFTHVSFSQERRKDGRQPPPLVTFGCSSRAGRHLLGFHGGRLGLANSMLEIVVLWQAASLVRVKLGGKLPSPPRKQKVAHATACSRPRAPIALLQPLQPLEQPGIRQIRGAGALCVFQSRGFLQNSASGLSAHGDLLLRGVEMSKQA